MNSTKGAIYPRKSGKPRFGIVATNSGMFMSLRQPLMTKVPAEQDAGQQQQQILPLRGDAIGARKPG